MSEMNASIVRVSFTVNDLDASLRFYRDGLGFAVDTVRERDGKPFFYLLKAGNGRLGIGQDDFAKGRDRKKGVGMRVYIVTTENVEDIAKRARNAGIKLDSEPEPLPFGPMAFSLTDPDGFALTVRAEG